MKYLLILFFLMHGALTIAQAAPSPPGTSPLQGQPAMDPQQELNALSGQLKDLHGQVHQRLGAIEKRITAPSTDKKSDKLTQHREQLQQAREDIENALNELNAPDLEDREMIMNKAREVMDNVSQTLERTRDTATSAVN